MLTQPLVWARFASAESAGYAPHCFRVCSAPLVPGEHYITPSYLCSAGTLFALGYHRSGYLLLVYGMQGMLREIRYRGGYH